MTLSALVYLVSGLLIASAAGCWAYFNRKPDRLELVTDGAWRLKEVAEKDAAAKEVRIQELEASVRSNSQRVAEVETKYVAQFEAQRLLHDAETKAARILHQAEIEQRDRVIARLTIKIEELEHRFNRGQMGSAVETRTTTTVVDAPSG